MRVSVPMVAITAHTSHLVPPEDSPKSITLSGSCVPTRVSASRPRRYRCYVNAGAHPSELLDVALHPLQRETLVLLAVVAGATCRQMLWIMRGSYVQFSILLGRRLDECEGKEGCGSRSCYPRATGLAGRQLRGSQRLQGDS